MEVVWRAGLNLEPVDLHDQDGTTWLEALVWPGEHDRLRLLRQAIDVARNAPPQVIKEDLRVTFLNLRLKLLLTPHSLFFIAQCSSTLKLLLNETHSRM